MRSKKKQKDKKAKMQKDKKTKRQKWKQDYKALTICHFVQDQRRKWRRADKLKKLPDSDPPISFVLCFYPLQSQKYCKCPAIVFVFSLVLPNFHYFRKQKTEKTLSTKNCLMWKQFFKISFQGLEQSLNSETFYEMQMIVFKAQNTLAACLCCCLLVVDMAACFSYFRRIRVLVYVGLGSFSGCEVQYVGWSWTRGRLLGLQAPLPNLPILPNLPHPPSHPPPSPTVFPIYYVCKVGLFKIVFVLNVFQKDQPYLFFLRYIRVKLVAKVYVVDYYHHFKQTENHTS